MTDVLDLIDGAISDWEMSPDAMRWGAEPSDARTPSEPEGTVGGGVDLPDELDRIDAVAAWMVDGPPREPRVFKGAPSWTPSPPTLPHGWVAVAHVRVAGTARTGR